MSKRLLQLMVGLFAASGAYAQSAPATAPTAEVRHAHDMRWGRELFVLSEVLELAPSAEGAPLLFDLVAWYGGPVQRLWIKADGSQVTRGTGSEVELQVMYGRLISPFFDVQVGALLEQARAGGRTASRVGAVIGLQGLAPGWFEVEPRLAVNTKGNVSADLTASYDLFITQRLVLQPRLEASAAFQPDPEFGTGTGLGATSFGLRTRYEIQREFAPYVGVVWDRRYGSTADLARAAGERASEARLVLGLRLWY